jgi:hypothetical protein
MKPENIEKLASYVNFVFFRKTDICDNMIILLENYSNELEYVVSQRTRQLKDEQQKTDALLDRMLPK